MIYVNRRTPHVGENDEDIYVDVENRLPVLWQWREDWRRFEQVQITSVKDLDRLIDSLRQIAAVQDRPEHQQERNQLSA